jgi:hypothetical protein
MEACARIDLARTQARKEFIAARKQDRLLRQQDPPRFYDDHDLYAFWDYVVTVWSEVNHALCELGRREGREALRIYRIREASERFFQEYVTFVAYPEDGRDRNNRPLSPMFDQDGNLLPYVRAALEEGSHLWRAGEEELEDVAKHQAGGLCTNTKPPVPAEPAAPAPAEVHATPTKASPSGKPGRRRNPETDPIVARWHAEGEPDIRTHADNMFPNEKGSRKRYDQVRGAIRREKERREKDRM